MADRAAVVTAVLHRLNITDELIVTGSFVLLDATALDGTAAGAALPVPATVGVSRDTVYIVMPLPGTPLSDGHIHAVARNNLMVSTRFSLTGRVLVLENSQERVELKQRRTFAAHTSDVVAELR